MKRILIIVSIIVVIFTIIGCSVIQDTRINNSFEKVAGRPEESRPFHLSQVIANLEAGEEYFGEDIENACWYVDGRYDCSDFRLAELVRILYVDEYNVNQASLDRIKQTLLNFKYWMDEPGGDSMCYWSENHQILMASAEYLAGQMFPDEIFTNTNITGAEHMELARERILIWLEQRWLYGFTEWYSSTYYVEDIAPLSNIIDFIDDEEIVAKAQIILDLLLYDVATQSYYGNFISTSGRAYEHGRINGYGNSMRAVIDSIWNFGVNYDDRHGMDQNFLLIENYKVPEVIKAIGFDHDDVVIKASTGLNLSELKEKDLIGLDDNQIMMQWNMEAFSNPEIISNSVDYINEHDMFPNEFLHDFKDVNYRLLRNLGLLPIVSKILDPQTNGAAIQRANTYTYRTDAYMLATAQQYHPGTYGDQHHVNAATLGFDVSIFHTHPAMPEGASGAIGNSPKYWVGYGYIPHTAQNLNVNLSIYHLPKKAGPMEKPVLHYTHAYFPTEVFDDYTVEGQYAFASYNKAYAAIIASSDLELREDTKNELFQYGRDMAWVIELADKKDYASFEAFQDDILSRGFNFNNKSLTYVTNDHEYVLRYEKDFYIDGEKIDTEYNRFDSPYAQVEREPDEIIISYNDYSLRLNFEKMIREEL